MGTKSLTAVKFNGTYKIAEYGHYDGYPAGKGIDALYFLLYQMKKEIFIEKLSKLKFVETDEEDEERIKKQKKVDGAEILEYLQDNEDYLVGNFIEFAYDKLFCEWAYLIDFDENTFEVYSAFYSTCEYAKKENKPEFKELELLKKYDLNKLPTQDEFVETFVKIKNEQSY